MTRSTRHSVGRRNPVAARPRANKMYSPQRVSVAWALLALVICARAVAAASALITSTAYAPAREGVVSERQYHLPVAGADPKLVSTWLAEIEQPGAAWWHLR